MVEFNEDNLQEYIDEWIDYGLEKIAEPSWIHNEEFTTKLTWILCEHQEFHTSPLDIIGEIQCLVESDFTSKKQKIIAVRELIKKSQIDAEYIGITPITDSRNRKFFASFYIPDIRDNEIHMIDSSFKCDKNEKRVLNQLLQEYRPRTLKPNGKPLSDKEILSLWSEAFD